MEGAKVVVAVEVAVFEGQDVAEFEEENEVLAV